MLKQQQLVWTDFLSVFCFRLLKQIVSHSLLSVIAPLDLLPLPSGPIVTSLPVCARLILLSIHP